MAMYTYLEATTADYTGETLSVGPNAMREIGGPKNQKIYYNDNGNPLVINLGSDYSQFQIELDYSLMTVAEANTIESIFHATAKANRYAKSFQLLHPIDTYIYVVQALSRVVREPDHANSIINMGKMLLFVHGYVEPAP